MGALLVLLAWIGPFDHLAHEAASGATPACASCHAPGPRGPARPGHKGCFRGGCHALPKTPGSGDEPRCRSCHATFPPRDRPAGLRPARDFGVGFSHGRHQHIRCEACHADVAAKTPPPPPPPHARCAACHDPQSRLPAGKKASHPLACEACHRPVPGAPFLARSGAAPLGDAFSHLKHKARGATCVACHAAAAAAAALPAPLPGKPSCVGCHDGKRAFSTVEPACTRCHAAPGRLAPPPRRQASFDHSAHAQREAPTACATCHRLDATGAPLPAGQRHAPCASCHAAEFAAPEPRICSVCHVGSEPWRPLRADAARRRDTEFGVEFSHAGHRQAGGCDRCHRAARPGGVPVVRGHAACLGAGCHDRLDDCAACHRLGLSENLAGQRSVSRFSVGPRFSHGGAHAAPACESCHAGAAAATSTAGVPSPKKPSCVACHDGRVAFKATGHACARCHDKGGSVLE